MGKNKNIAGNGYRICDVVPVTVLAGSVTRTELLKIRKSAEASSRCGIVNAQLVH